MVPIITATLLAALIIPLVRLFAIKSFRNRIGSRLVTVVLPALAITLYLGILGVLAFAAPFVLYAFLGLAVVVLCYLFWRARPLYGHSSGLAPGSLTLFPTGQWNDPRFYEKGFARYGPIFKTSDLHRPEICIVGIERIRHFLAANPDALYTPAFPFGRFIPGGFLRFTDPVRHRETRPIFQAAFARSVYLAHQDQIASSWQQELAALSRASLSSGNGVRPKPHLDHALRVILTRLFFGIDTGSPRFDWFDEMIDALALQRVRGLPRRDTPNLLSEMMVLIRNAVSENNTPCFAAELARLQPGALSDPYFTFNLIFMFQIARNDLGGLLQWVIKMLADNPEWLERVRHAPPPSDLANRIVIETLRLEQSEFLIRRTSRDIEFQGFTIPKGWYVRLCIKESHRLSDNFDNATDFDPDRFLDRRFSRSEYMPFGAFNKTCLGETLTLGLAKMFVTEIGKTYALQVADDGPQEHNGFHWQPSTKFRVYLPPSSAPTPEPLPANDTGRIALSFRTTR